MSNYQRYCKECYVEIGVGKSFCVDCSTKHKKKNSDYWNRKVYKQRYCKECGSEVPKLRRTLLCNPCYYKIHKYKSHLPDGRLNPYYKRNCKECGIEVGKQFSFCNDCLTKRKRIVSMKKYSDEHKMSNYQRYCKECYVEIGKGKSFCVDCLTKRVKERNRKVNDSKGFFKNWKKKVKGFFNNSPKKSSPQRKCKTCGVDVGKGKSFCVDCKIEKDREYLRKYFQSHKKSIRRQRQRQRYCKVCDIEIDKGKSYCSPCLYKIYPYRNPNYKRFCKVCDIEIDKGKYYCSPCRYKINPYENPNYKRFCKVCGIKVGKGKSYCPNCRRGRKYTICGFDGCKEPRTDRKHFCEYHSPENRDKRYVEEIVSCIDCGSDIGIRKDLPMGKRISRICNDCREIRNQNNRKRQIKYYGKWFKNKYHTDEGFRKRNLEYQKNYKLKQ